MKHYLWIGMLSLVSGISWAQCTNGTSGTNCSGPLSVQPQSGNTGQSAIILVDLGLPVPAPAGGQYTLSIAGGILQESDNGNSYHSLVGPPGPQGLNGALAAPPDYILYYGTGFKTGVGTSEVGGSLNRDQIDMSNTTTVRFVITIGTAVLPSGSYAQAEYTPDGTNWYALSGEVPVTTPNGTYSSGWQGLPTGANGDYVVRIVVNNAGTSSTQVGLRQLH